VPSPFPGMDPYLEDDRLWSSFHHNLVLCLYQVLLPGLVDRYRARVVERRYSVAPGEEHVEEAVAIRRRDNDSIVTLVDVVSPANKTTAAGRQAYLEQRRAAREKLASVVEIDLVLQGQPTLDYSREGLPDWDYAVTVTRSTQPEKYEIYTATLQKRLPRFRLPLARDDRDTVLDLQTAFARAYDQGDFAAKIDYRCDPRAPLGIDDCFWLDEVLRTQKLRDPLPPEQDIAVAAYSLWQAEGRPDGRDREHWLRAGQELRARGKPQ
jgi:hypothetical protein